jgi:hypothetical protein
MNKLEKVNKRQFNDLRIGNVVQYKSGSIYYVDVIYKNIQF